MTKEIQRGKHGKWKPGQSGNPSGRPPKGAQEIKKLIGTRTPELIETTVELALQGDMQAMKLLLDRIAPPLKATTPPVNIDLPKDGSLADNARAILAAAAKGHIPGDVASQLITGIGNIARVVEIDEIAARLDALEAAAHEQE